MVRVCHDQFHHVAQMISLIVTDDTERKTNVWTLMDCSMQSTTGTME